MNLFNFTDIITMSADLETTDQVIDKDNKDEIKEICNEYVERAKLYMLNGDHFGAFKQLTEYKDGKGDRLPPERHINVFFYLATCFYYVMQDGLENNGQEISSAPKNIYIDLLATELSKIRPLRWPRIIIPAIKRVLVKNNVFPDSYGKLQCCSSKSSENDFHVSSQLYEECVKNIENKNWYFAYDRLLQYLYNINTSLKTYISPAEDKSLYYAGICHEKLRGIALDEKEENTYIASYFDWIKTHNIPLHKMVSIFRNYFKAHGLTVELDTELDTEFDEDKKKEIKEIVKLPDLLDTTSKDFTAKVFYENGKLYFKKNMYADSLDEFKKYEVYINDGKDTGIPAEDDHHLYYIACCYQALKINGCVQLKRTNDFYVPIKNPYVDRFLIWIKKYPKATYPTLPDFFKTESENYDADVIRETAMFKTISIRNCEKKESLRLYKMGLQTIQQKNYVTAYNWFYKYKLHLMEGKCTGILPYNDLHFFFLGYCFHQLNRNGELFNPDGYAGPRNCYIDLYASWAVRFNITLPVPSYFTRVIKKISTEIQINTSTSDKLILKKIEDEPGFTIDFPC
jgi:hypothetical protein